jgi:hypothetical protein
VLALYVSDVIDELSMEGTININLTLRGGNALKYGMLCCIIGCAVGNMAHGTVKFTQFTSLNWILDLESTSHTGVINEQRLGGWDLSIDKLP